MKKLAFLGVALAMMLGFVSCDNRPDVVGQWQGKMDCPIIGASTSSTNMSLDFTRDGKVTATYLIDFTKPLNPVAEIVSPYEASVAANATVNGTWQYVNKEDDEIALSFDTSTLVVNVDSDMLVLRANVVTDQQAPQIDSLRPQIVDQMTQVVKTSISKNISGIVMEDVKVQKPLLKFEVNDIDYVFQAVNAN